MEMPREKTRIVWWILFGIWVLIAIVFSVVDAVDRQDRSRIFLEKSYFITCVTASFLALPFIRVIGAPGHDAGELNKNNESELDNKLNSLLTRLKDNPKDNSGLRNVIENQARTIELAKLRLQGIAKFARRNYGTTVSVFAALTFSVYFLSCSYIKIVTNATVATSPQDMDFLHYVVRFRHTEMVMLGAFVISFYWYRRFLKKTNSLDISHFLKINVLSFLISSIIALCLTNPDSFKDIIGSSAKERIPELYDIKRYQLLIFSRLILYPVSGALGGCVAWIVHVRLRLKR